MTTIICQHCEAKNEPNAALCVACGQPIGHAVSETPEELVEGQEVRDQVEDWVRQLPEFGSQEAPVMDDESLPAWLQGVRAHADKLSEEEAEELLDFLADLEPEDPGTDRSEPPEEAEQKKKMTAELPSFVAALEPEETWPEAQDDETTAQHLAEAKQRDEERLPSTAPLPHTLPLDESTEMEGIPAGLAGDELPEWLADPQGEQKRPDAEEPPGWPGRSTRLRAASIEEASPDSEPVVERGPAVEDIEAILGEVEAASWQEEVAARSVEPDVPLEDSGWTDSAQTAALEETLEEMMDLPDADTSAERVDQWLDILDGLPKADETEQHDEMMADADLDTGDVPDWMQSLQPEQAVDEAEPIDLGPPAEKGPLAGLRGIVPVAALGLTGSPDRTSTKLILSKEERQQAALLRQLTASAPEVAAAADDKDGDTFLPVRVILGGALLLAVLLGLLVPGVADLISQSGELSLPVAATEAAEAITVNSGRTALVAFDYTPTMSGELDAVAGVLLEDLAANDSAVLTVSQVAAGVPMAEEAVANVEGLRSDAIGYLPGEAAGLRAIGACVGQECETLVGRELSPEVQAALADINLIVVLTADRDSLAGWIEQVGTQSDVSMIGGVTQALGPVARPYYQSDQLAGLVEGLPVGIAYAAVTLSGDVMPADELASLTLAQWLAIAVLIGGALYFGLAVPAASAVSQVAKK